VTHSHTLLMLTHVTRPLAELYKMVCDSNETDLDINIPAVLLPKEAGAALERHLTQGQGRHFVFYLPFLLSMWGQVMFSATFYLCINL
jgi:hypothetical protein